MGTGASEFKVGDEVFGCLKFPAIGAFAEYVCASEALLALKPANMNFEEAAAVPANALGAEVTAVCSDRNLEQARALGATHAIDYAPKRTSPKGIRATT